MKNIISDSKGNTLYKKAKKIIPGGTQLFSKRPELYAPDQWPPYYRKASGCFVWDLDNRKYIDMTDSGIGSCLLGYADKDVNDAVKKTIDNGSMCTLNTPLEVELAQTLLDIHQWADMVRFARTGGEIMAVAVRIARASSERDGIAFCGYHGWHDWYLAANLSDSSNLEGHLLPGLLPKGVTNSLKETIFPFRYNKIEELKAIIKKYREKIGVIVMEPIRYNEPENSFLQRVKEIAIKNGSVLIFDEITSGWRHTLGGSHLILGVEPDIAVFAKALGNGFPIAAVIGKKDVMDKAQESFISSTYWTEAIGPTAAIATIEKFKRLNVAEKLLSIGRRVQNIWENLSLKHGIDIKIEGRPALTRFIFNYKQKLNLKTLLTQEMLKKGFLADTSFYPSYVQSDSILDKYENALDETFVIISRAIKGDNVNSLLEGPKAISSFARLT